MAAGLADRIVEAVRAQALPAGSHLGEQLLADSFRVSRTPVRLALQRLEQQGVVESRPGRGFYLCAPVGPAAGGGGTLDGAGEDPVYVRIAADRLEGELPHRVSESELIRRYGVTQGHLVRLLARMTQEGWIERRPGHGWEFQPILDSPRALEHSYQLRLLVEPAALLDPEYALAPGVLDTLERQQRQLLTGGVAGRSASTLFELGASFHEALVAGSPNPLYLDVVRRVNRLRRLLEYRLGFEQARVAGQCRSNLRLLRMLRASQYRDAAEYLRQHLETARVRKVKLVTQWPARPSAPRNP